MRYGTILMTAAAALLLAACAKKDEQSLEANAESTSESQAQDAAFEQDAVASEPAAEQDTSAADAATITEQDMKPELVKTTVRPGTGPAIETGKRAVVHYTGWLYSESAADKKGKKFDSSRDRGQPFEFGLGAGEVIRGWDQGVAGMEVGEQRQLIIPPDMAYGDRDVGGGLIPAGSTLVFDVELVAIN